MPEQDDATALSGFRNAGGRPGYMQIANGRIAKILADRSVSNTRTHSGVEIDLSGFLLMPGFINTHDHLQFALFPRLGRPPYRNYIDWGEDIHATFSDLIGRHKMVPKNVRLWWGGLRNLLCGVTTVCHHDTLWPELQREDFPVKVVQRYGWAHSLALGGDLRQLHLAAPEETPFIMHACEGVDDMARDEIFGLDRLGVLDARTVLVHGLAMDAAGAALMQQRRASLIVCPSSNHFLFEKLPDLNLLGAIENLSLGNDSPLTATGDMLDEIRFVIESCGIEPKRVYNMVTEEAATALRLNDGEGTIREGGVADLIAIRDTGEEAVDRLRALSIKDIELVMIRGEIRLASEDVRGLLPAQAKQQLKPLWIDGTIRWLRAPVRDLLQEAEEALAPDMVYLGGRSIHAASFVGV